jgi:hypothetical protein
MSGRAARRGQPLVALAVMLTLWIGARVWSVEISRSSPADAAAAGQVPLAQVAAAKRRPAQAALVTTPGPDSVTVGPAPGLIAPPRFDLPRSDLPMPVSRPQQIAVPVPVKPVQMPPHPFPLLHPVVAVAPVRLAVGHQLLWMAALARLPLPAEAIAYSERAGRRLSERASASGPARVPPATRWSGDAWVLYRRHGAGLPAGGLAPPSYGASQAGAVLRYALAPGNAHQPAIYLRGTRGFAAPHGEELAAGVSLRPISRAPVRALAELRVTQFAGAVRLRPAAMLVSELPPFSLPGGLRGETYVQGGFVSSPGATVFVDGQARADRRLARIGRADLRLGGGIWGGAQRGASRLDAGPSASLGLPLGGAASARLAMDWRFRLAGTAQPRSGPALTLSAGF